MKSIRIHLLAATTLSAVVLAACGSARVTETAATDDTIRFRFRNEGRAVHEAVIGDSTFQQEHAEEMAMMASMGGAMHDGAGDEPAPLVVAPGETAELIYTAADAGSLLIGCHQPGHWESGMKATIAVTAFVR
ncbi:MAG: copper-binding protein, plastocyanin/azurin family [Acidimicrobiaceae bacterium]|nr:MAG: copper-binding protein, plastocyanin/azurin family [Acidimicrobiaceae bacterium]